ncbi:hypothetical protein [Lentzea sp. E54]|uniref:hypothetical protein n=1 Tax=Lentzea xerophila TaxID=3435883 RepID=UPI003DA35726
MLDRIDDERLPGVFAARVAARERAWAAADPHLSDWSCAVYRQRDTPADGWTLQNLGTDLQATTRYVSSDIDEVHRRLHRAGRADQASKGC